MGWAKAAKSPTAMKIFAPAKLNLCLFLGPRREDGLHSLCSLFEPLALADVISVVEAGRDEVICPGVEGENLAAKALAALRKKGWDHPPYRIEIEKRTPVAAGLGGGSADAAAILRLAAKEMEALDEMEGLETLAAEIGADVPSQLTPAMALVQGAGEVVERLPDPVPHAVVLLPGGGGLRTADVFAEADRLGLGRTQAELDERADGSAGWPAPAARPSPIQISSSTISSPRRSPCAPTSEMPSRRCGAPAPASPS